MAEVSHTERAMRQEYERMRRMGFEHHEAMEAIRCAMAKAIPEAVKTIMAEIGISPPPPPICRSCNGFGYDAATALLTRASEEMRLIGMKDTGALYDVGLRTEIRHFLQKADQA